MSKDRAARHLPFILSIVIALALTILPLPRIAEPFRPDWVALMLIFWCLAHPQSYGIGIAWLAGLVVDVAHGTLLGQHALALTVIVYLTVRFHLQIRVFPLLQLTATVLAMIALYRFLLFWINGVAGVDAPAVTYWGPALSSALVWPILNSFLTGVRYRTLSR